MTDSDQNQAELELSILRQVLKSHFSDLADIRDGYKALGSLLEVPKHDPMLVTPELSGYYRDIVQIILNTASDIRLSVALNYDQNTRKDLPSFYISTDIFRGELYIPFERLYIEGPVLWSEVERAYDECWDRIQQACFIILENKEILAPHHEIFEAATKLAQATTQLPVCNGLTADFKLGTLQYGTAKPIRVGSQRNEMRFLKLMLENKNRVVTYETIAAKLDMNFYHHGVDAKEVAENLRYLKNDLGKLVQEAGMPREVFNNLIAVERNVGYILTCN